MPRLNDSHQSVLLLHAAKQKYQVTTNYPVPSLQNGEILVRTQVIGLNPLDWKAPDFNFALPVLPYIAGRELVGEVVRTFNDDAQHALVGDKVIVISTDYRDLRKACFQEFVVASQYNILRLPRNIDARQGASIGVGFVAAALALGVSLGLDFSHVADGPDLLGLVRGLEISRLAADIVGECLEGIKMEERAGSGDWIVIWGGSSVTATIAAQLARLAGLHVALVVNQAKHGLRIAKTAALRPDLLIDGHDPARAADIIRGTLGGSIRFALDTQGQSSTSTLIRAFDPQASRSNQDENIGKGRSHAANFVPLVESNTWPSSLTTPPGTPPGNWKTTRSSHVIGLAGAPKTGIPPGVILHSVPIKLFHEVPEIGRALTSWLYRLLSNDLITCPGTLSVDHGLEGVNIGLDRMRSGVISGGRAVVEL